MSYYYIDKEDVGQKNPDLPLNFTKTASTPTHSPLAFKLHNHDIFEVSVVTLGTFSVVVDGEKYHLRASDAVVIHPFALHEGYFEHEEGEYITLTCNLNALLSFGVNLRALKSSLLRSETVFVPIVRSTDRFAKEIAQHMLQGYEALAQDTHGGRLRACARDRAGKRRYLGRVRRVDTPIADDTCYRTKNGVSVRFTRTDAFSFYKGETTRENER